MTPILPIFLLLLLLPPLPLCSSLSLAVTPSPDDLIQKTCYSTTYYDFCVSSLSSSPQLTPASNATVKSLSAIIINLAISNATSTSTFASTLSKNTTTINPSLSSLLRMCAKKYTYAKEALQLSLVAMEDDEYDYALVHVSAAAEYPNVCRRLFSGRGAGGGVVYPVEMGRREEVLERLCTVASDIISVLQGKVTLGLPFWMFRVNYSARISARWMASSKNASIVCLGFNVLALSFDMQTGKKKRVKDVGNNRGVGQASHVESGGSSFNSTTKLNYVRIEKVDVYYRVKEEEEGADEDEIEIKERKN